MSTQLEPAREATVTETTPARTPEQPDELASPPARIRVDQHIGAMAGGKVVGVEVQHAETVIIDAGRAAHSLARSTWQQVSTVGLLATDWDNGDGDRYVGMDKVLHDDWDALFSVYQQRAQFLDQEE